MQALLLFFVNWITVAIPLTIVILVIEIPVRTFFQTTMFLQVRRKKRPNWPEIDSDLARKVLPVARERYFKSWGSYLPLGVFIFLCSLLSSVVASLIEDYLGLPRHWKIAISLCVSVLPAFWLAQALTLQQMRQVLRDQIERSEKVSA